MMTLLRIRTKLAARWGESSGDARAAGFVEGSGVQGLIGEALTLVRPMDRRRLNPSS